MSGALHLRLATRADDAAIRELLRSTPLAGPVALALDHEPSYLDAVEVMGDDRRVIVGELLDGKIVGAGVMALRHVYLNGKPSSIGYLAGLRIAPEARRFGALARGYRFFGQIHRAERRVPFYLSTIAESNTEARSLLTSRRAGLPAYHQIGRYHVLVMPLLRTPSVDSGHIEVTNGDDAGIGAVMHCLETLGPGRQLFPVLRAEDIAAPGGALRGLSLDSFLVASDGGTPVGTLAVWDQSSFRQTVVAGYSGTLRRARNLLGNLTHRMLPEPGSPLPGAVIACLAVPSDRPDVLRSLLRSAKEHAAARGISFLFLGMTADDPLLATATKHFHWSLAGRVYAVEWGDGEDVVRSIDKRPLHLGFGSL